MLQAMNTGHDGSLTTLHAGTAEEAILRLVLMARFGMDLPASIIEEQISTALDAVVMSQRLSSGERRITSFSTVARGESGAVVLHECVSYDVATDHWELVDEPPFLARGMREGLFSEEVIDAWRNSVS